MPFPSDQAPRGLDRWWRDATVRQQLEDIIDSSDLAADLVGRGDETFLADRVLQAAGAAITGRIGEAARRLPDDFRAEFPEVRWKQIVDIRNRVAHDYRGVDPAIVWSTLELAVPDLIHQLGLDQVR